MGEKKKKKNKPSSKKWSKYEIDGDKIKYKAKFCPRCGSGIFLAKHKDRLYCGRCQYTEFINK
ncbi:MAG: 30S ribosomal protein S27ae [Candidatus Pacearchaeota archaeon]